MFIPVAFQVAALLAIFTHPGHIVFLCSRGFAHLPPRSNLKDDGYIACCLLDFASVYHTEKDKS